MISKTLIFYIGLTIILITTGCDESLNENSTEGQLTSISLIRDGVVDIIDGDGLSANGRSNSNPDLNENQQIITIVNFYDDHEIVAGGIWDQPIDEIDVYLKDEHNYSIEVSQFISSPDYFGFEYNSDPDIISTGLTMILVPGISAYIITTNELIYGERENANSIGTEARFNANGSRQYDTSQKSTTTSLRDEYEAYYTFQEFTKENAPSSVNTYRWMHAVQVNVAGSTFTNDYITVEGSFLGGNADTKYIFNTDNTQENIFPAYEMNSDLSFEQDYSIIIRHIKVDNEGTETPGILYDGSLTLSRLERAIVNINLENIADGRIINTLYEDIKDGDILVIDGN